MNFKIIEDSEIITDYNCFKQDFLNPRMNVPSIKKKYDLSQKKYNLLKEQVCSETGLKRKPYKTMKNQTRSIITNNTYIHETNGKYIIQKKINGKRKSFGVYKDQYTAQKVRNQLIKANWNETIAEKLKEEYSIQKNKKKEAEKKYTEFEKLFIEAVSMKNIQEQLNLTRYQYNQLASKARKKYNLKSKKRGQKCSN